MDFQDFKKKYLKEPVVIIDKSIVKNPLLSVCVQTYQHSKYIEDCLNGILSQEVNFPFEILIGEDESNDGTREICIEYAKKYPDKIKLFLHHRKNNIKINGQPTGRFNFLYNMFSAKGKYIALCEGDDYWTDPFKLQKQVDLLEKEKKYSLCFHNVNVLNTRGKKKEVYPMLTKMKKDVFHTEDLLGPWFIPTASIIFIKKKLSFPDWFVDCESGDIALQLILSQGGDFKFLDKIMAVYRKHDGGISLHHVGYSKVFSMIYLYQSFNKFTGYKYNLQLHEAMKLEIQAHLPEFHELRRLRRSKKIRFFQILQKIKTNFKSK